MTDSGPAKLGTFLTGLRVLDLSQYIPGPMATLFLADMGAEVLKIEPPQGDEVRNLGPTDSLGRPIYYRALNAGKSILRMNLKDPGEHAAFLDLVREADIVVEGFRPGVMARLGIDWPVLHAHNPRLILCSINGYGAHSSKATHAGHDANYLAEMGVAHRNGGDAPFFYDPPLADSAGSLFAAILLLGALHGRNRTGLGCCLELALADTVMPLQMMQTAGFGVTGTVQQRSSYYLNGGAAFYQVYPIAEGRHIVLGAVEPKFWANFCSEVGRPDLITRRGDAMPQTGLMAEVAYIVARMRADEVEQRFGPLDCCVSVVKDLGETLGSHQVKERQLVRADADGEIQSLLPVWIDGAPPHLRAPLREAGAVGTWAAVHGAERPIFNDLSDLPDPIFSKPDTKRSGA
ncbi:MAG: CoA transferase [Paracoccaceae bacterium]